MDAKWKPEHINKEVIGRKLTYLEKNALMELAAAVWKANRTLRGLIIQAGCTLGGSAIVITSIKKKAPSFMCMMPSE
jgi:asparagine synthase (glutamine-hydrolysing)